MACRNNCRIRMYWHFVCRRTYRTWRSSPQKLLMCISQNYIRARRKNALSVLLTFEIFSFQVIFFFSGFLVLKLFSSLQSGVPGMPGFGVTGWESSVSSPPLRRRPWVWVVARYAAPPPCCKLAAACLRGGSCLLVVQTPKRPATAGYLL